MKLRRTRYAVAVGATLVSLSMVLTACGSGGSGTSTGGSDTLKEEPISGVPSSYKGDLPMPDSTQRYDNHLDRDKIKDGGTLTLPITEIGPNWNYMSADGNTGYMSDLWSWYRPSLVDVSEISGEPVEINPDYLTDMKLVSENPMVVQYDINPKAKWNSGRAFDYTDFQATWKTGNGEDPAYNPPSTDGYDSIESVERGDNDQQVIVRYKTPYYPWQLVFSSLIPRESEAAEVFTQGWTNNPHNEWGAGPYKVDTFDENQVTFVPNENWWGNKPKLDKITYKVMADNASINAFKNGEIDAIDTITTKDDIVNVRGVADTELRYGYSSKTRVLQYNGTVAPLDNLEIRKGLTQAFDVDTWNSIQFQGMNWDSPQPGSEIFAPYQKGYQDNFPAEGKYNVENAKKTFESAGYTLGSEGYYTKDGATLEFSFTFFGDDATQAAIANAYQAMMKKAGVKINIVNKPSSQFSKTLMGGDYQILPMAWQAPSAFSFISTGPQLYKSDSDNNFSHVGTPELDAQLGKPGTLSNYDDQAKAANENEKIALALYGTVPISNPPQYHAVKKGLANVGPSGFASVHPEDIGWAK